MEDTTKTTVATPVEATAPVSADKAAAPAAQGFAGRGPRKDFRRGGPGGGRHPMNREARIKPEYDQKILEIRRVTRVTSGGRKLSFSVTLVAGNRKGMVGIGLGKAVDTTLAIDKAYRNAKKNAVRVQMTKNNSIPHDVSAKYSSSRVTIMPAPGRGLIAGSSVRTVLELAGVKDVGAKLLSPTKNKLNNARVAIKALSRLSPVREFKKTA